MRIAILDPAAGISGDMTLGALLALGVPQNWLEALPGRLGFEGVGVTVRNAVRCGVGCKQVEFTIPERAHGRHVGELVRVVERAPVSDWVKERAVRAFQLVGDAEGRVHGVAPEKVHLHEVGAVDAVLDIVGAIEGFEQLDVEAVYAWPVAVGNGWVEAEHGRLPVPAPATAILLEGVELATGGPVEGEATTPTGAALVRVLAAGSPPGQWRMMKSGWGAGQRNPKHYPNALRILLGEEDPQRIGIMLRVPLPRAPPAFHHTPLPGWRTRSEDAHQRGPGRCRGFPLHRATRRQLDPFEQDRRGRRRDRQPAVR